jgi:1,2-diacylglycerol 3-alpha-glucosyltransferase
MRIGLFTDTYPPFINGVSTSVYMLKKALEKEGHTVFVVTLNNSSLHYQFEDNDTVIKVPGLPIGFYDYRVTTVYPVRALNVIRKWKLDVIHSHTEFSVGTFARIIARQYNIPLVHTYHTMYEDYTHYITKGYFNNSSKKIVEYLSKFYCDTTANELIVPTQKTYNLFKQKYSVNKNIHIIPTGIEIDRFFEENIDFEKVEKLRKKLKINKDDFNIIYVGRLAEEKNVDLLLDGHKEIIKKAPNTNLIVVGDGPDLDKYKEKVKKTGIDKNVIFTGKVPWEDVPNYYHLGKLFATASKSETQGLTVIEAMAAGVAPICIDDESFRNTVIDDLNGKIFFTKDEYVKIVLELINDEKKLQQLRSQARINAETHSSKFYAEQALVVYNIAIKNKNHSNYGTVGKIVDKVKEKKSENNNWKPKNIFKHKRDK